MNIDQGLLPRRGQGINSVVAGRTTRFIKSSADNDTDRLIETEQNLLTSGWRSLPPELLVAGSWLVMLAFSWRRWTSPIADSGREMDLPLRLLGGELLYRDISYLYPPLAPYFNALLYRLFGVHLDVLHGAAIVCSIVIVILSWRIATRVLDRRGASIAAAAVVILCIFKPSGNLISPYAFAALYGMVLSLAALLYSIRHYETGKESDLLIAGILTGLAVVTKQEFGLASAVTITGALVFTHGGHLARLAAKLAIAAAPALLIALPVYGWLIGNIGWRTVVEDCHLFYTHLPASLVYYNSQRTGMDRPLFSLLQMAGGAGVAALAMAIVVLLADRSRETLRRALPVVAGSIAAIALAAVLSGRQWDGSPLRALPLMIAAILIISWRARRPALFIIAVYSLAVLARVSLRVPSGGAFGGYFLPASLILFCSLFLVELPRLARYEAVSRRIRFFGAGILTLTLAIMLVVFGARFRGNFTVEYASPRGRLYLPKSSGPVIRQALDYIEGNTAPGEFIAVLPEGSDLVFLTGRRTPLRHQIMIPGLMSPEDEQAAIARLEADRVRLILIVNRPMREFGLEAFGRDFYTGLGSWIDAKYSAGAVLGAPGDPGIEIGDRRFFIKVMTPAKGSAKPARGD